MTARMRISTLELDRMNPRLVDEPGPDDQQNIIMRLWRHYKLPRLATDILEGMYLGPPAMLAVRQEGRTVVIDGNRRLAALLACHNHRIWDLAARESSMTGNAQPRQGDPEEEIIMFDSRDEAMRARIRRQTASGSMWSRMAHASHCRNLLMAGMEIPEINRIYGRQRSQTQQNGIRHMVNALNALEQVNLSVEHTWTRPWHYQALQEALFLPSVRRHLELRAPEEYGPDEPPLREESIPETVELVRVLNGSPLGSKENLPRKIKEEQDFWKLGEIYEDPRALEMLKNPQFHNVDQVHSFMSCRNDYHQAKNKLEVLHGMAQRELARMKEDPDAPVRVPGDIHLANTTYEVHNDGSVQYRVQLVSRDPRRDEPLRAVMQEFLEVYDQRTCLVELH